MPSVYVLRPISQEARDWIEEHVHYEDWNMIGEGIAIEHRYVDPIVRALLDEGFTNGDDFTIYC